MSGTASPWPVVRQIVPLGPDRVHVYAWNLDLPPLAVDWGLLSEEETGRARRFVFPRDRDRYVRAHAVLRRVLGGVCGMAPETLRFRKGAHGKPQLKSAPAAEPVEFNLSHSADIAVVAIARKYTLGIDVERVRPIDREIAEHHFSPRELRTLQDLDPEDWLRGFFRCWTAKEALLKGEGLGLNLPLDAFDVEAHPERAAALLGWRPPAIFSASWQLAALQPQPDTLGTVAVRTAAAEFSDEAIRCFALSE